MAYIWGVSFCKKVWDLIYNWLGCDRVLGEDLDQLLENHRNLRVRNGKEIWQMIWHACVWMIWVRRNQGIYNECKETLWNLVEKIKNNCWTWLKGKGKLKDDNHIDLWLLEPALCF